MNRDPMDSFDKPFQSGDGLCYPIYAKNYYKTQTTPMFGGRKTKKSQKGGNIIGDYSKSSTPSDYPGNAYLSSPNQRNELTGYGVPQKMNLLTESFLNSNMGITYATQAGGGRKKNKRGGIGANEFNKSGGVMNQQNNQNSGTLKRAEKQQSGGKNVVQEEMYVAPPPPTQVLSASAPSSGVFPIVSGGKYKKYSKKGGNPDSASIPLEITESFISMMNGGRYKKYSKKGGNMPPADMPPADMQPAGMQPAGMQPAGMQPAGIQPTGMQPAGMPPADMPPADMQPAGMQPAGMQPAGMQPAGIQPTGMQPAGMQPAGMQPAGIQPTGMPGMTGGRYKKYSKKGGNDPSADMQPNMLANTQSLSGILAGMPQVMSGGLYKKYSKKGGNDPSADMQPNMLANTQSLSGILAGMPQVMSGGRYKKYSKKGGNYIFTPGANFSSQPAEIATQMDPLAQAQHIPRGGFAMKNLSGVDAQMAASGSVMSGGRKKSSRTLKGGVSDFATTLSSRGPINYPDGLSAQRFRYFNKTGTYIPNSQLQYAAAPISTGYEADPNPYPMAYNDYIGGGAKKKAAPKKKAPAKKKPASDKKKK